MTEFKVGDIVTLSEAGIKQYSVGNWCNYPVPYAMYVKKEKSKITSISGDKYYVTNRTGTVYYHAHNIKLVEENKMFNVDEFRTGMRVVYRNGEVGIVLKDIKVIGLQGAFNSLPEQYEFEKDEDGWTIDEVYCGFKNHSSVLVFEKKGDLLWKREVETEAQRKVKELEQTILNAQKQLAELKKEI